MSAANQRRRQKKLEKKKQKRAAIQKDTRRKALELSGAALLQKARDAAFGPAWIASVIDEDSEDDAPALVPVIVSRRVAGLLLPHLMLVDRTCLGIKGATLLERMAELELREFVSSIDDELGPFRECDPLFAQSVVFHALDHAKGLGFEPHRDFRAALVEPRPEVLLDTPLGTPERPLYVSGPNDDVPRILTQLESRVGATGYTYFIGDPGEDFDDDDFDDEDPFDDDDDGDDEPVEDSGQAIIDTSGTPVSDWTERR